MHLSESKTTFFGRRIGVNAQKRKQARAQKVKRGFGNTFRWFKRRGWILLVALLALGVAGWMNRFYVQRFNPLELRHLKYIDIEGNRMLTWEDVIQNAQIEPGMLMSEVDADSVEKNLLQLPLIHSAFVEKKFPSSLTIKLKESSPVVSFFDGGKATVYSERGMVLPTSMTSAFHLPVVDLGSIEKIQEVSAFMTFMRMNDEKLYDKVSQVAWDEVDNAFEVYFRDVGHKVLFPSSDWNKDLFVLYESVKAGFPQDLRCAGEVDMRFTGFAYIRNFDKRCVNG
ncbi:MAG: FtsQ-type POTRA domain-containing protein [Fibrobacter sp.]|uniref:cell division protein FtsQ/DivIB n=1 Tax=Fibrobacter sp. TaxID=35828 RepID=UPI00389094E4|nr:FtsQ-type POTRA domain-containing protein [Fibrobacter sp.]